MREEAFRIEVDGVSTNGQYDGNTCFNELFSEVLYLAYPRTDMVVLHCLLDPNGHRFHVTSGKTAIGVHTLIHHNKRTSFVVDPLISHGKESADVHEKILLPAHGCGITEGTDLQEDACY